MPSRNRPRSLTGVSISLLLWMLFGVVQPASPSVPETVVETVPLDVATLAPTRAARAGPATLDLPAETWSRAQQLCAPFRFTMVGFTWRGAEQADAALTWGGGFIRAEGDPDDGPDVGSSEYSGIRGTAPVWTGDTRCISVKVRTGSGAPLRGLRATFINTSGTAEDPSALVGVGTAFVRAWSDLASMWSPAPAFAWTTKPAIRSRAQWGANEKLRQCAPYYMDSVQVSYIHHTATGNSYSKGQTDDLIRGIYAYHVKSLDYCDIAYHFVVDKWGRIWEGRFGGVNKNVRGGHAAGFNTGSVGISVLGTYTNRTPGSDLLASLRQLVRWRMDLAHVKPNGYSYLTSAGGGSSKYKAGQRVKLRSVIPHRRTSYTSCPGDQLARRVDSIRDGAARSGHPKIYRPKQSSKQLVHAQTTVRLRGTASKDTARWSIAISNGSGDVVQTFSGTGTTIDRTWDGTADGVPVPDGDYRARYTATWRGEDARPATLTIRVCTTPNPSTGLCPAPPSP